MPGFVQGNAQFSTTSDTSAGSGFASSVVAGNIIVVAISWSGTSQFPSVTDSQGNSYGQASQLLRDVTLGFSSQLFWTVAGSSGANTVTVTWGGASVSFRRLHIHEYTGWNSIDATASAVGDGASAPASGFAQAYDGSNYQMAAGDLLFASAVTNNGTTTAGTNFTLRETAGSESTEDRILPSAGAYQAVYPIDGSDWFINAATFTAATPRRIQVATNGGVTSSLIVTLSSAPVAGNLLVAFADSDATVSMANAGWTLQSSSVLNTAAYMWTKVAGASEPTTVTFTPATSDNIVAVVAEYSGVTTTPDIVLATMAEGSGSATGAPTGFTTNHDHDLIVAFAGLGAGTTGGARPSGPIWSDGLLNVATVSDGATWATASAQHAFYGERLSAPRGTRTESVGFSGAAQHRGQIVAAFVPAVVGAQTVAPTGVTSNETLGGATVTPGATTVGPPGIASTETFGPVAVSAGPPTLVPSGIVSSELSGTATITPGPVTTQPTGIGSAVTVGTPTVTFPAVNGTTVAPTGITSSETVGVATIAPGAIDLTVTGIGSQQAFGQSLVAYAAPTVAEPAGVLVTAGNVDVLVESAGSVGVRV